MKQNDLGKFLNKRNYDKFLERISPGYIKKATEIENIGTKNYKELSKGKKGEIDKKSMDEFKKLSADVLTNEFYKEFLELFEILRKIIGRFVNEKNNISKKIEEITNQSYFEQVSIIEKMINDYEDTIVNEISNFLLQVSSNEFIKIFFTIIDDKNRSTGSMIKSLDKSNKIIDNIKKNLDPKIITELIDNEKAAEEEEKAAEATKSSKAPKAKFYKDKASRKQGGKGLIIEDPLDSDYYE